MRLTQLYLFQCGENELFAFSIDKTGCNIPRTLCQDGWLLRGHVKPTELMNQDYADVIAATTEFGFCLLEIIPSQWIEEEGSS